MYLLVNLYFMNFRKLHMEIRRGETGKHKMSTERFLAVTSVSERKVDYGGALE
jgi:hypothetical protein